MSNPTLPAAGTVVATETVSGNDFQKIKLFDPTPGSEAPIGVESNPLVTTLRDMSVAMQRLLEVVANPLSVDPATSRMRVSIEAGSITTVSTLSNMAQVGGINANQFIFDTADIAWATSIRERIV